MSAAHAIVAPAMRTCAGCGASKTVGNFAAGSEHCYVCVALIERAAFVAKRSGIPAWIWKLGKRRRVEAEPTPVRAVVAFTVTSEPGDAMDQRLETLFGDILLAEGFGSLSLRIERVRRSLARRNRDRVDREGWIV